MSVMFLRMLTSYQSLRANDENLLDCETQWDAARTTKKEREEAVNELLEQLSVTPNPKPTEQARLLELARDAKKAGDKFDLCDRRKRSHIKTRSELQERLMENLGDFVAEGESITGAGKANDPLAYRSVRLADLMGDAYATPYEAQQCDTVGKALEAIKQSLDSKWVTTGDITKH